MTFKALLATKTGKTISTSVVDVNEDDLMSGDLTIAVDYSTVNYKDALAIAGRADIIRQFRSRLARDIDLGKLARTTQVVGLAEVPTVAGRRGKSGAAPSSTSTRDRFVHLAAP